MVSSPILMCSSFPSASLIYFFALCNRMKSDVETKYWKVGNTSYHIVSYLILYCIRNKIKESNECLIALRGVLLTLATRVIVACEFGFQSNAIKLQLTLYGPLTNLCSSSLTILA